MAQPSAQQLQRRIDFGQQIRARRIAKGLSQEAFAHLVGLDRTYVGGVERGERNVALDNIHRLADALGLHARDLF